MFPDLRRNPAFAPFIAIVLGIAVSPHLLSTKAAIAAVLAAAVLSLSIRSLVGGAAAVVLLALAGGLWAGLCAASNHEEAIDLVRRLPYERFVEIQATIDQEWIPGRDGRRTRVRSFEVVEAGQRTLISQPLSIFATDTVPPIGESDRITAEGFLRESRNGRFYVSIKSPRLVRLESSRPPWHPRRWNRAARSALDRHVEIFPEHARAASLIRAVALGDGSTLSAEMRESYRQGGTYHLLVFSGMQIAFAAAFVAFFLHVVRLGRATDLSLVLLAIIAPQFAGNEPSVGRASMMIGVFGLSRLAGRPTPTTNLLFLSASLRLLFCPEELTSPGFLLTYGATFGLVVVGRSIAANASRPSTIAFSYGLGAELCTQPLTLFFFRHYVAGGFVITLLLSPVLSLILLLTIPIVIALWWGSDLAWPLVEIVARLDGLAVIVNDLAGRLRLSGVAPAPSAIMVIAGFGGAWALFLSRLENPRKAVTIILTLLMIPASVWMTKSRLQETTPAVEVLDVGQGDAILIRGETTVLVDGGGSANDPEFGRRTLVPMLADRGLDELDVVVMSHPDVDHCGGLVTVAGTLEIGELWLSPRHLREPCTRQLLDRTPEARLRFLRDGEQIELGGLRIDVTIPRLEYKNSPINNGSVVLTAIISGMRLVLAGDVEREAEHSISDEAGSRLRGDVLKVPHHGSPTSSSATFLDTVQPRLAIISCELDNIYGHPAPEVLERLRERSIHLRRTDHFGTIRIEPSGGHLRIITDAGKSSIELTKPSLRS